MEEFAMREWLTIIIGIAILAVVLDGIRRMRHSRADSIRSSSKQGDDHYEPQTYGSELPKGGARVVSKRDESEAEKLNNSVKEAYAASKTTKGFRIPEQVALNLDESVPMLMDSVAEPKHERRPLPQEPSLGNLDDIGADADSDPEVTEFYQEETSADDEPTMSSDTWEDDEVTQVDKGQPVSTSEVTTEPQQLDLTEQDDTDSAPAGTTASAEPKIDYSQAESVIEPEEVFVINIMAPKGFYFAGSDLLDLAVEAGLRLGEMNIFHRHHRMDGSGPIVFSMANIVMPGTFQLESMRDFKTPGVSLFLTLPCDARSMDAFELFYGTADYLADSLGGELKDEQRNVLTSQTVEHYRQRIRDFELNRLKH
ncbi:cell division protein ZipA [Halioxenophilus aromaticivorans]|uniref:Cell division protein ZipA n=1 Tax=Halioxenophilus aromaticivorans TaxID=1306992 RepID=A0AAV3TXF6_9ALTE